jgi:predicted MFS family arabinose efflux permease
MEGLFALNGMLCLAAMLLVKFQVPDPAPQARAAETASPLRAALLDGELLRLNAGIFVLHIVLYAMFVVVPTLLVQAGLALPEHWKIYLPVVLGSFVLMVPAILHADRANRSKPVLVGAVLLLCAAEASLAVLGGGLATLAVLMLAFFVAFNVLEALLPSLVSRLAPARGRGVAIGVYNTTQTLGVFFGGLVGGWVASHYGTTGVFAVCAVLTAVWFGLALGMRPPRSAVNELSSITFSIASGVNLEGLREALARVRGVHEAEVVAAERLARLKVVPGQWDEHRVRKLITGEI